MVYTFLDFETTGKDPSRDIPVSCAFVSFDKDLDTVLQAKTMYFYDESRSSDAGALAIHGITDEFLYAHKDEWSENMRTLFKLFYRGYIIGHNIKSFDYHIGKRYLERNNYNIGELTTCIDTISIYQPVYHKRMKLREIVEDIGMSSDVIDIMHEAYFGVPPEKTWHAASYDVTATIMAYKNAIAKNYV